MNTTKVNGKERMITGGENGNFEFKPVDPENRTLRDGKNNTKFANEPSARAAAQTLAKLGMVK